MSPLFTKPAGRPGKIIEFVGLPGAGKSTVSHALAETLRNAGGPVSERSYEIAHRLGPGRRRMAKLRLAVRAVLRRPRAALSLVLEITRTRQRDWIAAAAKTLDLLYVCGLVAERSRRSGLHVLDQGFFGGLFSIGFGASSPVPLGRLVAIGTKCCGRPPADLVVILDVAPHTAVQRLMRRPGSASRLEKTIATLGFERDLRAAAAAMWQVRGALAARGRAWGVCVVPDEDVGAIDTLALDLADWYFGTAPLNGARRQAQESA